MGKSLGGSTFIYNGIKQDYCFIETLECLAAFCDRIAICYGGDDGTIEAVNNWIAGRNNVYAKWFSKELWDSKQGREKLSYFSNQAIEMLDTDWNFYLQADEILHEKSFEAVLDAIEMDIPAHLVSRINLWGSPYYALDVPQERKPCSTEVIRLAKTQYRCVGDAESLGGMSHCDNRYLNDIRIYHMGFVRDPIKHLEKIRHIQDEIFLIDHDKRIDGMEKFDPWKFFSFNDVKPITEPLPVFIQQWAHERVRANQTITGQH